jgi:cation diffusion facilitator family transporter
MQHEKEQVALTSIAASAALTIAKGIVGFSTGSLAILSEAGHSLIDLGATIMTYAAVRVSGKPADDEHHYGHGKVESVSALGETALLFLLSGIVIWEAVKRLIEHEPHIVVATNWAFIVMATSVVIDFFRARALTRVAKATQSQALEADALHFSSDLWSSLAVIGGLIGVSFGIWWADSVAALAVALLVCVAGWRLGRRTIDTLTDTAPAGAVTNITDVVEKVAGVVAVEDVRARSVGDKTFIDLTVAVSRTLPLDRVSAIKGEVASALSREIPGAESIVTPTRSRSTAKPCSTASW